MTPREMALTLARALDSKKGKNIRVLEINNVTTLADYFVLCTGTSAPQLKALADAGEKAMKEAASRLEFELAAALRDQIIELKGQS